MAETTCDKCNALSARIDALAAMLGEREDRTKERFANMEKTVGAALVASDKAVAKAEMATEKRFENVNEFRAALQDQTATLLPKSEYAVHHGAMLDTVTKLTERVATIERLTIPRAEYSALHNALEERVTTNTARLNILFSLQEGKKQGLSLIGQVVLGTIAAVAAAAATIGALLHR